MQVTRNRLLTAGVLFIYITLSVAEDASLSEADAAGAPTHRIRLAQSGKARALPPVGASCKCLGQPPLITDSIAARECEQGAQCRGGGGCGVPVSKEGRY